MRKTLVGLGAGLALFGLAACAGGPGPGYGPPVGPVALADCNGFYDDFYGPFADGCWGGDGAFWWRDHDGLYHRDEGGHFSHAQAGAMHAIHGVGPGAGRPFAVARGGARPGGGDHR